MDQRAHSISSLPRSFYFSNVILFFLSCLGGIIYAFVKGLEVKIPVSFCFLLLGCINTVYAFKYLHNRKPFVCMMFAGLLFGFMADIVLELHFILGAGVFALGHIFYVVGYSFIFPLGKKDLLPCAFLLLLMISLILFAPFLDFGGSFMQGIVLAYGLILAMMLGKALGNYYRESNALTRALLIGSILFFFSDTMLLLEYFANAGRIANILCVVTYFPAQAILAHTICRELS